MGRGIQYPGRSRRRGKPESAVSHRGKHGGWAGLSLRGQAPGSGGLAGVCWPSGVFARSQCARQRWTPSFVLLAGRSTTPVSLYTMSPRPQDSSFPQYPAPVLPHPTRDDEAKAPYDDLIDQYASPYGNQAHRTYAVDPASLAGHARQPSYPLSKHSYTTSKDFKSLDSHGQDTPDWEYPPPLSKEDKKDEKETSWSKVRLPLSFPPRTTSTFPASTSPTHGHVDSTSSQSLSRPR